MNEFRTVSGVCTITDDSIEIEESLRGQLETAYYVNKLYFYLLVVYVPLFSLYVVFTQESGVVLLLGMVFTLSVLVYLYLRITHGFGTSGEDEIPIDSVVSVEAREKVLTAALSINYRTNDSIRERMILVPKSLFRSSSGELEKAVDAFDSRGIETA
ncbi:hypothetical protein AUR64_05915 [Haloprofundus marisrubri]|uniref:Uncharacterized protein n=1 Tax=Haloprofundus marisrubri TaxID=1514971 RepID=A0A0W1RBB8_9EURY|nr:hypothetical protein [Haloprofundus marisrubri]KTG10728.1 hypothetical protein AUR64_05915 [Haloprofundus marisrubri]